MNAETMKVAEVAKIVGRGVRYNEEGRGRTAAGVVGPVGDEGQQQRQQQ